MGVREFLSHKGYNRGITPLPEGGANILPRINKTCLYLQEKKAFLSIKTKQKFSPPPFVPQKGVNSRLA